MIDQNRARSVVVTGGTTRLGAAIAAHLRAVGWRVLTTSHRPDAGADIVADLADPMGAARLYASALNLLGGVPPDALVNNAAIYVDANFCSRSPVDANFCSRSPVDANFCSRSPVDAASCRVKVDGLIPSERGEDAASTLRTINFLSPQKLTILMAGREIGRGENAASTGECGFKRGAVVNVLDANLPDDATPYRAAKRELARETVRQAALFAETLRVNAIAPGPVLPPVGIREKAVETPLGRPTPEAVAQAVEFLLEAEFTTGVILPVDGGSGVETETSAAIARMTQESESTSTRS